MNANVGKKRVAITGMGAVTAPGHSFDATWQAICEGYSCADRVSRYRASKMPTNIAYEVRGFQPDLSEISEKERVLLNDAAMFALGATTEAIQQSGINQADIDPLRYAVCVGAGMGSSDFDWFAQVYSEERLDHPSLSSLPRNFPSTVAQILTRLVGAKGGTSTVHTACASSGQSVGEAYEMIASGERDIILTGGVDSMINPFHMAGFSLLGALSKRNDNPSEASRPFDADRDGFVLGEGACIMVLEEWEHAVARGAKIQGEIAGYGCSESAYRITDLHPDGHGPIEAMQRALDDAGIKPSEVGYINAHGTSTLLNDRIESLAVEKVFGVDNSHLSVSSTKSVTGHMISAAGAMELAVAVKALQAGLLPPSTNLFEQDEHCRINVCGNKPAALKSEYALSNSVGFGGSNTALIARRVSL